MQERAQQRAEQVDQHRDQLTDQERELVEEVMARNPLLTFEEALMELREAGM